MPHPVVQQLRFARSEFVRGFEGVTEEEGLRRFLPINSLGWMVGHLAWQEQRYWLQRAQGKSDIVVLDEIAGYGSPATTPSIGENGLPDEAIDVALEAFGRIPTPLSAILFEQLGGAVARVGRDESAFDHRDAAFNMAIIARWASPDESEASIAWTRELSAAMKPYARGAYVNYLGVGDASDRVRAAYGDAKYNRLAELKARYDPENIFRFNQNITPRAAG